LSIGGTKSGTCASGFGVCCVCESFTWVYLLVFPGGYYVIVGDSRLNFSRSSFSILPAPTEEMILWIIFFSCWCCRCWCCCCCFSYSRMWRNRLSKLFLHRPGVNFLNILLETLKPIFFATKKYKAKIAFL